MSTFTRTVSLSAVRDGRDELDVPAGLLAGGGKRKRDFCAHLQPSGQSGGNGERHA